MTNESKQQKNDSEFHAGDMPNSSEKRFCILSHRNKIADDAHGYGYKTFQSATKAMWYKFGGGKEKIKQAQNEQRAYFKDHPGLEQFIKDMYMDNFKEISRDEVDDDDLLLEIKEKFNINMPRQYLKVDLP